MSSKWEKKANKDHITLKDWYDLKGRFQSGVWLQWMERAGRRQKNKLTPRFTLHHNPGSRMGFLLCYQRPAFRFPWTKKCRSAAPIAWFWNTGKMEEGDAGKKTSWRQSLHYIIILGLEWVSYFVTSVPLSLVGFLLCYQRPAFRFPQLLPSMSPAVAGCWDCNTESYLRMRVLR